MDSRLRSRAASAACLRLRLSTSGIAAFMTRSYAVNGILIEFADTSRPIQASPGMRSAGPDHQPSLASRSLHTPSVRAACGRPLTCRSSPASSGDRRHRDARGRPIFPGILGRPQTSGREGAADLPRHPRATADIGMRGGGRSSPASSGDRRHRDARGRPIFPGILGRPQTSGRDGATAGRPYCRLFLTAWPLRCRATPWAAAAPETWCLLERGRSRGLSAWR